MAHRIFGGLLCAALLLSDPAAGAGRCAAWPAWESFKHFYISDDGRVVDASTAQAVTVSEGQAYALLFALAADDRPGFERIWRWTRNNLSAGDAEHVLPAWRWGRAGEGTWGVLDHNSAADADLWLAYALAEAGRLWHSGPYSEQGRITAALVLRDEVALIPGLGATLLPGPRGFVQQQTWRLNASYLPLQVLRRLQSSGDAPLWMAISESAQRVIVGSAPHGYAADWILYHENRGFTADTATEGAGSYNAIRVYLWAGMLADDDPQAPRLLRQLAPLAESAARGGVPESVNTETLTTSGHAPVGFLAALLPLWVRLKLAEPIQAARQRLAAEALRDDQHYYSDVLSLFGLGWLEGRLRFDRAGQLHPQWTTACTEH
ncbi:MAG: cellulase [Gammaproteobacteria bacterium]|nr:cellulase [Gammaproteobacteria bacterium]